MASVIWDDAIEGERLVTEQDVRAWIDGAEKLECALNDYIRERNKIDTSFHCDTVGETNDGAEVGFSGTVILVTFNDRWDNSQQRTIPIEHLWNQDWESAIKADVAQKLEAQKQAERKAAEDRKAAEEKKRKDSEAHELATYKRLHAKYGVMP
jgi:hypothetical protein